MFEGYFDGEDGEEYLHKTRAGVGMRLQDMGEGHLLNTIRTIEERAKSGDVCIHVGGGYFDYDSAWCDTYYLDEEEALSHLKYHFYVEEARRRGLKLLTH